MLTIHMPENRQKKQKRRKLRGTGYLIAGLITMALLILSYGTPWWIATIAFEVWWLWAAVSDLGEP